jgi:hypothetical protein
MKPFSKHILLLNQQKLQVNKQFIQSLFKLIQILFHQLHQYKSQLPIQFELKKIGTNAM